MNNYTQRAADTILESHEKITIGGRTFSIAPPTCATLIAISKLVSKVPAVEELGDRTQEVLAVANDCDAIFEQIAILIKGAKALKEDEKPWIYKKFHKTETVKELADWLKENTSPSELNKVRSILFSMMEVNDFFELVVFLKEVNLIQMIRKTTMTQSGQ